MLAIDRFTTRRSFIHSLDPRVKIFICLIFCFYFSISKDFLFLLIGLVFSTILIKLAKIKFTEIAGRLLFINLFLLVLFITVPLTFVNNSECYFKICSIGYSIEKFQFTLKILLRSNILILLITSLFSTINFVVLGHALNHLLFPKKLIHLFLFSIRYLTIIHQEYIRMKRSAIMRSFTPEMNIHTYKTFAHFAGMLLIRSLNRSERIAKAMKCRGFNGNFYLIYHFQATRKDWLTGLLMLFFLIILMCGDFYV
ncbi:MAG: energy-coupling factor transporter transmembrane protein EcfT [Victivallaceae bacterium]|nr:energy-coupling factor transporter transmembrane protein EcfT [Victivallaceae bacterium]